MDVVNVVFDLCKVLIIYNGYRKNSNYELINMGIGIYFGFVIMGMVGLEDRMDIIVIGDSVNIVFCLEVLIFKYEVDIIVSV